MVSPLTGQHPTPQPLRAASSDTPEPTQDRAHLSWESRTQLPEPPDALIQMDDDACHAAAVETGAEIPSHADGPAVGEPTAVWSAIPMST
jgi:hypothetical protein